MKTSTYQFYICVIVAWISLFYCYQAMADSAAWHHVFSHGEPVRDIEIDPANPETVYTVSGKILSKSDDGGKSWKPIFNAREEEFLFFVKCPKSEPGTIYTGGGKQIFKSTDSGKNWKLIYEGEHWHDIRKFTFAETMPQRLYILRSYTEGGIYRSDDGGTNWVKFPLGVLRFYSTDIAVSAVDANTVYLVSEGAHNTLLFLKSQDGGEIWSNLSVNIDRRSFWHIATHPTKRDSVYIFYSDAIASSRDGGETWTVFQLDDGGWFHSDNVWFDHFNPNILYAGTRLDNAFTKVGNPPVYQSLDGGITWEPAKFNLELFGDRHVIYKMKFHPIYSGIVYLSAIDYYDGCSFAMGLYKSNDTGITWRRLKNRSNFDWIQLDADGQFAYVRDTRGYWRLSLRTNEMKLILKNCGSEPQIGNVAVLPTQPGQIIAYQNPPGTGAEIIKSHDAGESWETVSGNTPEDYTVSLTIVPTDSNTIYLCRWFFMPIGDWGASGKVYKTTDGGYTWVELKEGLPPESQAYMQIFVSSAVPQTVYLLAHDVEYSLGRWSCIYRSDDAGEHWRKISLPDVLELDREPSKREWVERMAISPHHPNILYVMTNRLKFFELSADGKWVEKSQGLPQFDFRPEGRRYFIPTVSLIPDPDIPGRIYAAIITGDFKQPQSVYVKFDADSIWEPYDSGLEAVEVNSLAIDSTNRILYAATTAGIYCTPLYETSAGFRPYLTDPIVESRLWQNYPNPLSEGTYIPYQLLDVSDVTIDIYGVSGELVQSLKLGNQTQKRYVLSNRAAYWNGRNANGEKVADGIYFYTLKVNGNIIETERMAVIRR